jgi:predicted nucleotidyltransferase/plasmid stability protein
MSTRTLTLRGIPVETLRVLRVRAESHRRSLNSELLTILQRAAHAESPASVQAGGEQTPAPPRIVREAANTPRSLESQNTDVLSAVDADELARVCRLHHVVWLAVFGSHARGDAHADSDVDVVVEFAPGMTPGLGFVRVADALRPLFGGRRVDLVTRRGLSPRLRERVLSSAVTLYDAQ